MKNKKKSFYIYFSNYIKNSLISIRGIYSYNKVYDMFDSYFLKIIIENCGCHGLWPRPPSQRPRSTKDYNQVGPASLACEPNLRAETQISSSSWKGVDILWMSSLPPGDFI